MRRHAHVASSTVGLPEDHECIVAALMRDDSIGCTADEISEAIDRTGLAQEMQQALENLVAAGILERWGIGRGALYRSVRQGRLGASMPRAGRATDTSCRPVTLNGSISERTGT